MSKVCLVVDKEYFSHHCRAIVHIVIILVIVRTKIHATRDP
jgi:hypothetical protein